MSTTQFNSEQTGHGYPRLQHRRADWHNLNGKWQFAFDPTSRQKQPSSVSFDREILVPFAPETRASGLGDKGLYKAVWYRRVVQPPTLINGERLVLHFQAVDWSARVWIDDQFVGEHEGGYTPFALDITEYVAGTPFTITVRAEDCPYDLEKNRGKQDWQAEPHGIWYERTTGIWQTVWMEVVPALSLASVFWSSSIPELSLKCAIDLLQSSEIQAEKADESQEPKNKEQACKDQPLSLRIKLKLRDELLADNLYSITASEQRMGRLQRTIRFDDLAQASLLPDGAADRLRERYFWHPNHPNLIDVEIELLCGDLLLDRVESYTQFVSSEIRGEQILINNCPDRLRLVLDQGYWQDSGMTPPDDRAIQRDIELIKAAGFNGVRKHNKLEDPRFLYWADKLGLFVWEELPSAYHFTPRAAERSLKTWSEAIKRDRNHGCIIAWVPVNESWGVLESSTSIAQRHYQRALYHLTRSLTNGLVIGNDGWEMVESDIIAIHDYDSDCQRLESRYGRANLAHLFSQEKPGGRTLLLENMTFENKPIMLTEFGGIKLSRQKGSWGYSEAKDAEELASRYEKLLQTINRIEVLGGFCYTEFTDVFQEANGLFWMDRSPKFDLELMRKATLGQ